MSNQLDITIYQNASYAMNLTLYDDTGTGSINATSWSFTGSIRAHYGNTPPDLYFTSSVINYATASVDFYLGADDTWRLTGSKYFYDVLAYNPTVTPPETYRLVQGTAYINKGVTEPVP